MARSYPKDPKILEKVFANRSIDTSKIAFYNSESFLKAEQNNPHMLALYGCHVDQRLVSDEIRERDALCIETLCQILYDVTSSDDQLGTCVDISGMLSKFLELYGVWNYCISGSMNIHNPALEVEGNAAYFWTLDTTNLPAHAWVVAPPYSLIDLSVQKQPYSANELDFVPNYVLEKSPKTIQATTRDHVSPERRMMQLGLGANLQGKDYYRLDPDMKRFDEYFSSYGFVKNGTTFRYLSAGILMTDAMTIADLTGRKWNGKYPTQIFEDHIRPQMRSAGFETN